MLRTEVAVVGSGPGGAITACLLAEAGRDVLLIEEGPLLPLTACAPFSRDEMVLKYRNGGITAALGSTKVRYVEGCCVGGGSEINSGLYHRTPTRVLDEWRRQFQVDALAEADLQPHFDACEKDLHVSHLSDPAPAASLRLHQGAQRLGWQSLEVPRWYRHASSETGQCREGIRQSMSQTYVPRFLAAGGRLLPCTRVRRLVRRGSHWEANAERKDVTSSGFRLAIRAETIFVAGGAIQTPALLLRSGFRQNVGNGLRLHPTIKVVAEFPEEVNDPEMGVPVHQVKEFAPHYSFGCSISSPPHLAVALADHAERIPDLIRRWRRMAVYYAMTRGGQGTVRTIPFFRDAKVSYRLGPEDLREVASALRNLCRCLLAAGASVLYCTAEGIPPIQGEGDLDKIPCSFSPGQASLMTVHLFSTCPMGEDRSRAVASSFGRVHNARNLYLADASLLCGPPGVNPQGSVMAITRRNALKFLGRG